MINRYYTRPSAGLFDFFVNFAATRKAKEEAESGLRAQADAQQNAAIAGAVGDVAGAGIGAFAATRPEFEDLSAADRLALASSFVPGMRGVTQTARGIGGDISQAQRQKEAQERAIQGRAYNDAVQPYIERYGTPPPSPQTLQQAGFDVVGLPGGPAGYPGPQLCGGRRHCGDRSQRRPYPGFCGKAA